MRAIFMILLVLAALFMAGCGGKNYKAQLDFLTLQLEANRAAESARADRLQERETMCAGLTEPGAISACMLGITATTLAERSSGSGQQQIVMPPQAPRTGFEVAKDLTLGALQIAAPAWMGDRQAKYAHLTSVANSNALYGFLGSSTQAWADFGGQAIEGMGVVSIEALQNMRGATADVAAALPLLAPRIEVNGHGNAIGTGNTAGADLSRTGGDRFQTGDAAAIAIDRSFTGRDRRESSPDTRIDVRTRCTATGTGGAPGAPTETDSPQTPGTGTGTVACSSEVP